MQSDIYNFVKLDNISIPYIVIFLAELNEKKHNDELFEISKNFYRKLLTENKIEETSIIIISFIKHYSKSIKSLTFHTDEKNNEVLFKIPSLNSLIADFIVKNQRKKKLENFIVYKNNCNDNPLTIHNLLSKYPLDGYHKYYN